MCFSYHVMSVYFRCQDNQCSCHRLSWEASTVTQFSWKVPVKLLLPLAEMLDRTHQGNHLDLEGLGEIYEQIFNLMSTAKLIHHRAVFIYCLLSKHGCYIFPRIFPLHIKLQIRWHKGASAIPCFILQDLECNVSFCIQHVLNLVFHLQKYKGTK